MISAQRVVDHLRDLGTSLFVGVPDSLLKPFGQYVMEALPQSSHLITADEGAAVAVALGHYTRTGSPALVYLQNSGLGNAVNPLLSLADRNVYGIPMLLLIGWRGQPGVADEPQHVTQGRVMTAMLDAMEIPFVVVPHDEARALGAFTAAHGKAMADSTPVALLVEKGTFEPYESAGTAAEDHASREEALEAVVELIPDDALIVSTTGMLSRELFELRARSGHDGAGDFLTVGGMGHASAIALGVALTEPDRSVWCLDGDGALLMHTGTLATIAHHAPSNFRHVVFNNGVHDSVGGQPTSIGSVSVISLSSAMGYGAARSTQDLTELTSVLAELLAIPGPTMIEVMCKPGSRSDLGRPTRSPRETRDRFMNA